MPPPTNNPTIKKKVDGSCSKRTVVGESKATTTNKSQIKEKVVGSCSDRVISKAELEKLKGQYLDVARTLLGTHPIKSGRVVATVEDLAILLMLLKYFTLNMNADGSLPWARVKGLWDALYEVGDVSRAFDPKRFAALRNYLSSLGLLDWADSTYHLPQWVEGAKVRGKACKWKANDLLMGMLQVEEGVVEETSLAGTNLQETISKLKRTPFADTIIPLLVIPMPIRMPTDEELRQRLGWAA